MEPRIGVGGDRVVGAHDEAEVAGTGAFGIDRGLGGPEVGVGGEQGWHGLTDRDGGRGTSRSCRWSGGSRMGVRVMMRL